MVYLDRSLYSSSGRSFCLLKHNISGEVLISKCKSLSKNVVRLYCSKRRKDMYAQEIRGKTGDHVSRVPKVVRDALLESIVKYGYTFHRIEVILLDYICARARSCTDHGPTAMSRTFQTIEYQSHPKVEVPQNVPELLQ